MSAEREFEDLAREGVARMKARREAERQVSELAGQDPDTVARGLIVFARGERDRLRRELEEQFGFTAIREQDGLWCCPVSPQRAPKTLEQKTRWVDAVVTVGGLELALEAMLSAAVYFPWPDQPRKVCDAFSDVMRETPAIYSAFADSDLFEQPVRKYASVMAAAWVRSHLKKFPGSRTEKVLEGESWARELANATSLAWQDLGPDSPIKRSTRFRDTLPRQRDGRRQKAPGPPDLVNLVSKILDGGDSGRKAKPLETDLARFADREALLKRGRDAGLAPREMEIYTLYIETPTIKNREVADRLGVCVGTVKKTKNRIKKALYAA